jgi:hypothetical protein
VRQAFFILFFAVFFAGSVCAGDLKTLNLKVGHLACASCVEKFRSALSSVCKDLTLDEKTGEAVCRYEEPVTPEKILFKANRTGLPTEILKNAR